MSKNQFYFLYGLEDTGLGQKLMFKEQNREFVQILHNGNYHWVVLSNIICSKNEIDYYDSLFHRKIRDHEKMQIFNIFKCSCKELKVNAEACQQQANGVDCGAFAIANTFHVSTGADIGKKKIQDDEMKDHLLQCIKSGHFQKFEKSGSSDIVSRKIMKNFRFFVTADFLGHGIIPKTKIWIWYAVIRARNGIIANVKTYQTLFLIKNMILIGVVLVV